MGERVAHDDLSAPTAAERRPIRRSIRATPSRKLPAAFTAHAGVARRVRPEQARQPRVRKEKGFLDHATDFGTGLWLGGKDAVVGVKDLAVGAFNVSLVGMVVDREQWEESNRNLQQTVSTVVENPAVVWDAIKQPYVEAWEEGRPLEAVGRGTFEVIATVAGTKGLDKVAKGSKATSAVTKLDDVAEAASATAKTTSKVDDAARASTKVDAVAPKAAKAEVPKPAKAETTAAGKAEVPDADLPKTPKAEPTKAEVPEADVPSPPEAEVPTQAPARTALEDAVKAPTLGFLAAQGGRRRLGGAVLMGSICRHGAIQDHPDRRRRRRAPRSPGRAA